jgi:hypothetical protein
VASRDPVVLRALATEEGLAVRFAVACNPATPADVIDRLLEQSGRSDEYVDILEGVTRNPATPPERLAWLASLGARGDHHPDRYKVIRALVAMHPATTPDVLARLAVDRSDGVRKVLVRRPGCPRIVLEALARDEIPTVRVAATKRLGS